MYFSVFVSKQKMLLPPPSRRIKVASMPLFIRLRSALLWRHMWRHLMMWQLPSVASLWRSTSSWWLLHGHALSITLFAGKKHDCECVEAYFSSRQPLMSPFIPIQCESFLALICPDYFFGTTRRRGCIFHYRSTTNTATAYVVWFHWRDTSTFAMLFCLKRVVDGCVLSAGSRLNI